MTIADMKKRKSELGYTNEMIAQLSGVPLGTVQKIFGGTTASPRYLTLQKIERVLEGREEAPAAGKAGGDEGAICEIKRTSGRESTDLEESGDAAEGLDEMNYDFWDFCDSAYERIKRFAKIADILYANAMRDYSQAGDEGRADQNGKGRDVCQDKREGDVCQDKKERRVYQGNKERYAYQNNVERSSNQSFREPAASYGPARKDEYTIRDYFALPEDTRAELIDGRFFYMEAPGVLHQELSAALAFEFKSHVSESRGECRVLYSPCAVKLDADNRTMVEPDVLVVCDRTKIGRHYINGAPDLIIEILSKSTRRRDLYLKVAKYEAAGVREYWIVDAEGRRIIVYNFEKGALPALYGFDQRVPVAIWKDEFEVDFGRIAGELEYLYKE